MIFCDTSTLAKYYVLEVDSAAVLTRLDKEDQVALSIRVCGRFCHSNEWRSLRGSNPQPLP